MNFKIFKPEVFQGNLKKRNYFEGWYFKNVSSDLNHVWSFIPGISLNDRDPHSFIQVINGSTAETQYITYPLNDFFWKKRSLYLKIGNSVFAENYIDLKIENDKFNILGRLDYDEIVKYPVTILSPGIMGLYSFVPFMECKHGIVSVNHNITGSLNINSKMVDFNGGKGYTEKDWGTSFPEAWMWIQANNFKERKSSFSFSVAKIPWLGKFFIGFIAFLYYNEKYFLFSTYNNSSLSEINHSGKSISFKLKNHYSTLRVSATKMTFGELRAPVSGNISRRIKESIDSEVNIVLSDNNNNTTYYDSSPRAGIEVIDKIFDYLESS